MRYARCPQPGMRLLESRAPDSRYRDRPWLFKSQKQARQVVCEMPQHLGNLDDCASFAGDLEVDKESTQWPHTRSTSNTAWIQRPLVGSRLPRSLCVLHSRTPSSRQRENSINFSLGRAKPQTLRRLQPDMDNRR